MQCGNQNISNENVPIPQSWYCRKNNSCEIFTFQYRKISHPSFFLCKTFFNKKLNFCKNIKKVKRIRLFYMKFIVKISLAFQVKLFLSNCISDFDYVIPFSRSKFTIISFKQTLRLDKRTNSFNADGQNN